MSVLESHKSRLGRAWGEGDGVAEVQRARLLAAMTEIVFERGTAHVTIAHVVGRAGVSRRTFYELFDSRDACFLAAFDDAIERAARYVLGTYDPAAGWTVRMRTATRALLELFEADPVVGRLVVVDSLGAGPAVLERRRRVLDQIVTVVDEGRDAGKAGGGQPPVTAEGVVGGALSLIHNRMLEDGGAPLVELLNPLMAMIVMPYLGVAAARRELSRPAPEARDGTRPLVADPLRDLDMRFTYRTMRVLLAVGAQPSSSNRLVAEAAGVRDQGQISKLLVRLENLGLIRKRNDDRVRGEPNEWVLTERGKDVRDSLLPHEQGLLQARG